MNETKPPLDNLNVRLGIEYATNFALVCQQYFRGDCHRGRRTSDGYGFGDVNPAPDASAAAFPDQALASISPRRASRSRDRTAS